MFRFNADRFDRFEFVGAKPTVTAAANLWLGREDYDPVYGARPLRRAITRSLENTMSKGILSGEFTSGDHILVDAGEDTLTLTKVAPSAPETAETEPATDEAVASTN